MKRIYFWGVSSKRFVGLHRTVQLQLVSVDAEKFLKKFVGPLKTDESWWRGLTECGPLEKGMSNHFSILALRTL